MNMKRKAVIGAWIFMIVAVTFAGIAAVNFLRGVSQRDGTLDAGRAQIALVSATIGIAFGLLAVAVPLSCREW
jgi:hypothetical protein